MDAPTLSILQGVACQGEPHVMREPPRDLFLSVVKIAFLGQAKAFKKRR
jgi:hypothetical protein